MYQQSWLRLLDWMIIPPKITTMPVPSSIAMLCPHRCCGLAEAVRGVQLATGRTVSHQQSSRASPSNEGTEETMAE
eukprot:768197-Hanusia_phi.AAC.2